MSMKQTPGEWVAMVKPAPSYSDHGWRTIADVGNGILVCGERSNVLPRTQERSVADARLIAASPDLLSGCNALLGLLQLVSGRADCPPDIRLVLTVSHRIDDARAAIAKAMAS